MARIAGAGCDNAGEFIARTIRRLATLTGVEHLYIAAGGTTCRMVRSDIWVPRNAVNIPL